jgi:hypothetical protein
MRRARIRLRNEYAISGLAKSQAAAGLASPEISPGGEMIAQPFGFTRDFARKRNTDCICKLHPYSLPFGPAEAVQICFPADLSDRVKFLVDSKGKRGFVDPVRFPG